MTAPLDEATRRAASWRRDEYARLLFVEQRIRELTAQWRRDAASLRRDGPGDGVDPDPAAAAAAELDGAAEVVDALLDGSRMPGGAPLDHLAEAKYHLEELGRERAAAQPPRGEGD